MKKPILLHYYITNICNAKCEFCNIWQKDGKETAKIDDVERNLAAARKLGAKFVDFTGGEPLLNPDLPEFLKIAKKYKFITSVTTNTLLFEKFAEKLNGKIDLLHFSIDGNREVHDKIRGVKSFDSVIKAIPLALANNLYPDLLFTYTNENIDCFEEVYEIAKKNKLLLILDPVFSLDGKNLISKETDNKAKKFAKLPAVYLNAAHFKLRKNGGNNITAPICKAVESTIVILPDNSLALPCYHNCQKTIKIDNGLKKLRESFELKKFAATQGKLSVCQGCHIACYMDPSYQYRINSLFFSSILSKFKYSYWKYFIFKRRLPF
jgi:MoaA/NifB/PqqE/SkfB family radical SAM enzyme